MLKKLVYSLCGLAAFSSILFGNDAISNASGNNSDTINSKYDGTFVKEHSTGKDTIDNVSGNGNTGTSNIVGPQSNESKNYYGSVKFSIKIKEEHSEKSGQLLSNTRKWSLTGNNSSLYKKESDGYVLEGIAKGNNINLFSSSNYKQIYMKAAHRIPTQASNSLSFLSASIVGSDGYPYKPGNSNITQTDGLNHQNTYVSMRIPQLSDAGNVFLGYEVTTDVKKNNKWETVKLNNNETDLRIASDIASKTFSLYDFKNSKITDIRYTLKPILKRGLYSITFDTNGGTSVNNLQNVYYGEYINLPNTTRNGYSFAGWYDSSGKQYSSGNWKGTNNVKLTAKWVAISQNNNTKSNVYRMHILADGGTLSGENVSGTENYDFNSDKTEFVFASTKSSGTNPNYPKIAAVNGVPTKKGSSFSGWTVVYGKAIISEKILNDGNKEWVCKITSESNSDIAIKANWGKQTKTVKFDSAGGSKCDDKSVEYGTIIKLPTPEKENFTFAGWISDSGAAYDGGMDYTVTSDVSFKAKWVKETATVHFRNFANSTSGKLLDSTDMSFEYEDTVSSLDFKNNYDGYEMGEIVTKTISEKEVYIDTVYNSHIYTISLSDNEQIYEKYDVGFFKDINGSIPFSQLSNIPAKTGYNFDGYYLNGIKYINADGTLNSSISNTSFTENANLTAKWKGAEYKIIYNMNISGEYKPVMSSASKTVIYGETYGNLESPKAKHFSFDGWYFSDNTKVSEKDVVNITRDTNVYAHWKENSYTIIFNDNCPKVQTGNVVGNMDVQNFQYTETNKLSECEYSLNGYIFTGWNTEPNGSGKSFSDKQSVNKITEDTEITLYAQWKENSYTLTYNANVPESYKDNIIVSKPHTYTYEEDVSLDILDDITGYTFGGWNTEIDGSGKMYEESTANEICNEENGKITLFAVWKPIKYNVTFNANAPQTFKNDVFGTMKVKQCNYDEIINVPKNNFSIKLDNVIIASFLNWNTEADGSGKTIADKGDFINLTTENNNNIILYAQWKINSYSILYDNNKPSNDASLIESPETTQQEVFYNEKYTIINGGKVTGYKFVNWNTKPDGTGETYNAGDVIKNLSKFDGSKIKLYAQWDKSTNIVSFNVNVNPETTNYVTYGYVDDIVSAQNGKVILPTNSFKICNDEDTSVASFVGWSLSSDGNGEIYKVGDSISIAEDTTLYAQWQFNADESNTEIKIDDSLSKKTDKIICYSKSPDVSVIVNGNKLENGSDFTASYNYDDDINEGTININLIGNYNGSFVRNYSISNTDTKPSATPKPTKTPNNNDKNDGSDNKDLIINGGESNVKPGETAAPSKSPSTAPTDDSNNSSGDTNTEKNDSANTDNNNSDNTNNAENNINDNTGNENNNTKDNQSNTSNVANSKTNNTVILNKTTVLNGITVTRNSISKDKKSAKITLSWKKVKKAKRYVIYKKNGKKWKKLKTVSKNKMSLTIKKTEKYKIIAQKKVIKKVNGEKKTIYKKVKKLSRTVKFK